VHRNNNDVGVKLTSMGRPPKVSDEELVGALQATLDWPEVPVVETDAIAAELGINQQTVRNRLKAARESENVPIGGSRPGNQGGWMWWLTDADCY
jgi:predicted transcriptional regulator